MDIVIDKIEKVEKRVQIDVQRAQRLEQIAAANNMTEDMLVAQALDLLFREQEQKEALAEDWEALRQLEEELGPAPRREVVQVDLKNIVSVVGTPIKRLRHLPNLSLGCHWLLPCG